MSSVNNKKRKIEASEMETCCYHQEQEIERLQSQALLNEQKLQAIEEEKQVLVSEVKSLQIEIQLLRENHDGELQKYKDFFERLKDQSKMTSIKFKEFLREQEEEELNE